MKKIIWSFTLIILMLFLVSCDVNIKFDRKPVDTTDNPTDTPVESKIDEMISNMSVEEKISQMIMLACRSRDGVNFTRMTDGVDDLLHDYGLVGMILFAQNCETNEQTFNLIKSIQEASIKNGRPGLLIAVDQEGGRVTRLEEGTAFVGNMALGAAPDKNCTLLAGNIIGMELNALGFNVDFAPVADINNNPNNPVIGVRSFSDDKKIVSRHVAYYLSGLRGAHIIGSLKHFPGHGDTATDSHTGLPLINKTLEELKEFELYPYQENIEDIEMIMTAHIVYPQIDTGTYRSKSTRQLINLPATLSKTIITDVLRNELGYQGVVITDALEMAAIAKHFDKYDVAKLAINAGVDILLMPIDISTRTGITDFEDYVNELVTMVNDGEIDIKMVDAAVKRVLTLKENHQLLDGYTPNSLFSISEVGDADHHHFEWEIAKEAITLVKNEGALPIVSTEKALIIADSSNNIAINYALNLAEREADIVTLAQATQANFSFDQYDKVIILSNMANTAYLNSTTATQISSIISTLKEKNIKSILLSTHLPYDVARFSDADALVLCYCPRTMTEDPTTATGNIKQYGPNIPAAISLMFQNFEYVGRLPVQINKLDDNNEYTDEVLFERGYSLSH